MIKRESKNRIIKIGLHIFIWAFLFSLPYLLLPEESTYVKRLLLDIWSPLIQYALIFYLNYFLLIKTLLFRRKFVLFFLINIGLIAILSYANMRIFDFVIHSDFPLGIFGDDVPILNRREPDGFIKHRRPGPPGFKPFMIKDFLSYSVPLIFSVAVRVTERWIKSEAEKKEIENRNLKSELIHLKYQIQPHFFFNSLNNIYSLIEKSPEGAQTAILDLSKLMRYMLYDTGQEKVDLNQEISFLTKFIELMKLRLTNRVQLEYSFPQLQDGSYSVAPLLFIPLIENAFKHGVSVSNPSRISFKMTIHDNQLHFSGENTFFPKDSTDKSGSGIGLDNLKKRLELIYPDRHIFKTNVIDGVFLVILSIELD